MNTPIAPAPPPQYTSSGWIGAAVGGALMGGLLAWLTSDGSPYNPAEGKQGTMAYVMCQNRVRSELRAPASAEFPNTSERGVSTAHKGGGVYEVRGYVDAQNGFGAMLRNHWECEIQEDENKRWQVKSFAMK